MDNRIVGRLMWTTGLLGLTFVTGALIEQRIAAPKPLEDIIHMPASGCPAGYIKVPDFFEWQNGKKTPACATAQAIADGFNGGGHSIDKLMPGEGAHLFLAIPQPPPPPKTQNRTL